MSENPKERILLAATELLMRYGYTQMTVDELAKSLGMSKKTIYKHYSGKAELADAVIETFFAELNAKLAVVIASEKDYPEKLSSFLKTVSTTIARASHLLIAEFATAIPELWQKILVLRQQTIQKQATRLIQIGIEEGTIRSDVDPNLFLLIVLAALESATDPQRLLQTGETFDTVFEQVMEIVFTGILNS